MKNRYRSLLLLLFIFFFGLLLRTYNLQNIPTGFHRDEAFFGYNAYSLFQTARDINGIFLPLHIASSLYTPAGYSYFTIPSIDLFGLSQFSVRFPSALFGSLTILITFFLAEDVFFFLEKNNPDKKQLFGLLAAFMLAISPWHINLSRTASVITIVSFFISFGVLLFLKSIEIKNSKLFILSFISFFISLFFYIAPYFFLPLFIPTLLFLLRKQLSRRMKVWGIGLYIGFILLPLVFTLISPQLSLRVHSLSISNSPAVQLVVDEQIRGDGVAHIPVFLTRIFHNRILQDFSQVSQNYFSHFSYNFLFTDSGFPDRYRVPLVGLLYLWELPFFLLGFFLLVAKRNWISFLLLSWVFLAPIGSSFATDDVPNLQRTMLILPGLTLVVSYGIWGGIQRLSENMRKLGIILLTIVFCYGFLFYIHQYYFHATTYRPWYRQDGYKELVTSVNQLGKDYSKIVITNRESAPTIFFLFYNKYDPAVFQKETAATTVHDLDHIGFGKFEFSQEECPVRLERNAATGEQVLIGKKGILYVDSGLCNIPPWLNVYKKILRHDNSVVFYVVSIK